LDLIQDICALVRIQQKDLRCIYQNKELSSYTHVPAEKLNLADGDIIHLALRLKGGADITEQPRHSNAKWNFIKQLLSPTKDYYLGNEIPEDDILENPEPATQATGEFINEVLEKIIGREAHVIHRDAISCNSIFDKDPNRAEEGIQALIDQLFDRKYLHLQDKQEVYFTNPPIDKPIIAILNTSGGSPKPRKNSLEEFHGSHWVTLVILPKGFSGFNPDENHIKEEEPFLSSARNPIQVATIP